MCQMKNLKVMNITVEEMPTGEIAAGAGTGTDGTTFSFSLTENNYYLKKVYLFTMSRELVIAYNFLNIYCH